MKKNAMKSFTFSTGVEVLLKPVSPMLLLRLRRQYPPPEPPMQEVDYDGEKRFEPNPAHPDHQKALQQYEVDGEKRLQRLIIKRGVVMEMNEERRAELAELREFWATEFPDEAPANLEEKADGDLVEYIVNIAIGNQEDLTNLVNAVTGLSMPTEEDIANVSKSFQGEV